MGDVVQFAPRRPKRAMGILEEMRAAYEATRSARAAFWSARDFSAEAYSPEQRELFGTQARGLLYWLVRYQLRLGAARDGLEPGAFLEAQGWLAELGAFGAELLAASEGRLIEEVRGKPWEGS